ncbi:YbeD family protein [Marinibactrum halimedae]|uniref:UPF0250 protein GCM10007877_26350 n=1 Tax=Marinibactrum halimedae TaxID=1444977 RepID=A0AA37WP64_9GAMM|nr:DUF493 domain-containing protein [Marinibactrum halimedae]MCD9458955.1 DUF493 domain-containing protein [Marinibactrum halimedae]GLS26916.1 UPF0250 protein [Marinibactrum halimedae]
MVSKVVDSQNEPPKIEFPCPDYPIKVMGDAGEPLRLLVIDVFGRHAPGFDPSAMTVRDSSKGTFQSITVKIEATGEPQLRTIFEELKRHSIVKMVI